MMRATFITLMCSLILCACTAHNRALDNFSPGSLPLNKVRATIIDQASHLGIEDGWYFGEEPRVFKTPYGQVSAEKKADFAMAYEAMLTHCGENMLTNWQSYVPYSQRSEFARSWWSEHSHDFGEQSKKIKILWIHESLLDGAELWWRAVEKLAGDVISSPAVLTHDEEQRLVFKYAENERSEGSLSSQYR